MQDNRQSPFDYSRYLRIIQRKRYLVICTALAVISVFTWGSFLLPKVYEASSTVAIDKSGLINPLMQGIGVVTADERLRNVQSTIVSRNLLERVIRKLNPAEADKGDGEHNGLIAELRKSIHVVVRSAGGQTQPDLFTISYRGRDPQKVHDLVTTLVNEFIAESAQLRRTEAGAAYDFVDGQLAEYKQKLEESEKAIRTFREANPTMVPQHETVIAGRMDSLQSARLEAEITLRELQRKRKSIELELAGKKDPTSVYEGTDNSPRGRLSGLNSQLITLLTKFTDDYPEVVKIRSEIAELQKQVAQATKPGGDKAGSGGTRQETRAMNPVYRQMKEELAKTDAEIASARVRLEQLAREEQEGRIPLGRMLKEQEEWTKLQRDRDTYQQVYDGLLKKRESANITRNMGASDTSTMLTVVDPPIMPRQPVSPDRVKLILLGIALGIAAGVGAVVGLDAFDRSFKDEDSLQKVLHLPVLASVPTIITEEDLAAEALLDKKVYTAAAAYLSLIGLVFIVEFLHRYLNISLIPF